MKDKMNYIPLNGDMLTYYYNKDNFIMSFTNSNVSYYLPKNWSIEKLSKDKVPYRLFSGKCNEDGITVASSMIANEINLIKFIRDTVKKYNDPNLDTLKVKKGKDTFYINLNRLNDQFVDSEIDISEGILSKSVDRSVMSIHQILEVSRVKED